AAICIAEELPVAIGPHATSIRDLREKSSRHSKPFARPSVAACTVRTSELFCTYEVYSMVKRLTRQGNSVALVLDKKLLEQVDLDADGEVEVSTNGDVIIVTPVRHRRRTAKVRAAVEKIDRLYAGAFKRLAK
ncbi:MAG TPA: hypothetical protein VHB97_02645, partial [Polyangia bacterium]|nr:hypothetical protein [Polyangia bacterium]